MPHTIPISELRKTDAVSKLCREADEPVFVTKNGHGEMVIMSIERYEKTLFLGEVYGKLEVAKKQVSKGYTKEAFGSLDAIRARHNV